MHYREAVIWLSALLVLYFMDAGGPSLCLFRFAGLDACPGCGLGHAIHYALHGEWYRSVEAHWLGIPATAFLVLHAVRSCYKPHKPTYK